MITVFIGKLIQSLMSTSKTIAIQKNKILIVMIFTFLIEFTHVLLMSKIIKESGLLFTFLFSFGSVIGSLVSMKISTKYSKERVYVHTCKINDIKELPKLSNFLKEKNINFKINDAYEYVEDMETSKLKKIVEVTIFCETKEESKFVTKLTYDLDSFERYGRFPVV